MDEFNNNENELFETDNAVSLETGDADNAQPVAETESSPAETASQGASDETFRFDENGEYHFTKQNGEIYSSSETQNETPAAEPEFTEQPHTIYNQPNTNYQANQATNPYAQNPYRNPYNQQSGNNGGYYNQNNYQQNYYNNQNRTPSQPYNQPARPEKSSSKGKKIVAVFLSIIIIFASIGIGISIGRNNNSSSPTVNTTDKNGETVTENPNSSFTIAPTEATTAAQSDSVNSVSPGIRVAKKARGSVVGVTVYNVSGNLMGEGSGVVMGLNDAKDTTYIITCAHVISDSSIKSCGIMLEDGKVYQASIVGYDERTDIGVLSVKQTDLQVATFGDSTALQVGETVYAIGNPGGSEFYGSMTSGIVSALDRSLSSTYNMTVIQHNAAISPGNSGGALVNSDGQVIGINSSKISATDYEGIGFAVPISVARPVVENLIKFGYVPDRPKLGITYASVTNYWRYSAIVQSKGLPAGSVIIASISEDSSFTGSEVAVGDMITSVNGKKLEKSDILLDIIENSKVGDELKLGICRIERSNNIGGSYNINEFTVTVKLVEDKGSSSNTQDKEEETTESFYDYYYGNGNNDNNFEDFFSQFFGSGF